MVALLVVGGALAANGTLDPTFGTRGLAFINIGGNPNAVHRIALSTDQSKIYALGTTVVGTVQKPIIVRFTSSGSVDNSYGTGGQVIVGNGNFSACGFAVQPDQKVVVGGSTGPSNFTLFRYLPNTGTPDNTFGTNGVATLTIDGDFRIWCNTLALQPDHKIVLFGYEITATSNHTDFFVLRANADGSPDDTFVGNGFNIIDKSSFPSSQFNYGQAVAFQGDGKIILAGAMQDFEGNSQISLARLNTDGELDKSFGTNGKGTVTAAVPRFHYHKASLAIQADGKLVVAGTTSDVNDTVNDLAVARFNTNGALDTAFGGTGIVITDFGNNEQARDVVIQKDGKIVVVGTSFTSTSSHFLLVRYNTNGSLDTTFGTNGKVISNFSTGGEAAEDAVLQSDTRLLTAGTSSPNNMVLARYDAGSTGSQAVTKTFTSLGASDGWILESSETSNTGGTLNMPATTFNAGDDVRDRQYRSILSFQTQSIPDNAAIASVELKIRKQGGIGVDPFTTHGDLLAEIRQGYFGTSSALQLGDFSAAASSVTADKFAPLPLSWYSTSLADVNLKFINKIGITQFRLRFTKDDDDDLKADYAKFFSGNAVSSTDAPKLIITYYVP